jgi:hypothetical protein
MTKTEETPDFQPEGETAELLSAFRYQHLPPHLQAASKPWCDLAHELVRTTPPGRWLVMSLEHLMIAKDAAVRARLPKP